MSQSFSEKLARLYLAQEIGCMIASCAWKKYKSLSKSPQNEACEKVLDALVKCVKDMPECGRLDIDQLRADTSYLCRLSEVVTNIDNLIEKFCLHFVACLKFPESKYKTDQRIWEFTSLNGFVAVLGSGLDFLDSNESIASIILETFSNVAASTEAHLRQLDNRYCNA